MKIGILTFYYQSLNCGGNLQAYALTKFLNGAGFDAEQISYVYHDDNNSSSNAISISSIKGYRLSEYLIKCKRYLKRKIWNSYFIRTMLVRKSSFEKFQHIKVPHSENVYTDANISESNDRYDVFITGSDQVWNLNYTKETFFLSFVKQGKGKLSYAASMAMEFIPNKDVSNVKRLLSDFNSIMVREDKTQLLLSKILTNKVYVTLDPTLLLNRKQWNDICAKRFISDKYVFAYFLGENRKSREIAFQYARSHKLKLVVVPFANGQMNVSDLGYGDLQIKDFSPELFISLVRYAEYVFTDSFHATVFSFIYEKQYFVFDRNENSEMSSRIESLTNLFEQQERYCNGDKCSLNYIQNSPDIRYDCQPNNLAEAVELSKNLLINQLLEIQDG